MMSSKGQVTIPKTVRDSLHLHAGDKVEFVITETKEVLLKPVTKKVDDVFGRLHKPGRKPISIEKMDLSDFLNCLDSLVILQIS